MKKTKALDVLIRMIDEGFNQRAWHGPNLRSSIRGLTARQAAWRPSQNRHNIWENVVHCAYWKYVVRRRILGEKKGTFPVEGSNWFKRPQELTESAWKKDVRLLEAMHKSLSDTVRRLKPSDLRKKWGSWSAYSTISGIAMHDVYHAGQIRLLRRMIKRK